MLIGGFLFVLRRKKNPRREKARFSFSPRAVNIVRQFPVKRRFEYELG